MLSVNGLDLPDHPAYKDLFSELKRTLIQNPITYISYPAGFGASTVLTHAIGWCFNSKVAVIDPIQSATSSRLKDYGSFMKYVQSLKDKVDPENITIVPNSPSAAFDIETNYSNHHVIVIDLNSKIYDMFDKILLIQLIKKYKSHKFIIIGKEGDDASYMQIRVMFQDAIDRDVYKFVPSWVNTQFKSRSDTLKLIAVKDPSEGNAIKTLSRKFITQFKKNDVVNKESIVFIITPYVMTYVKYLIDNVVPKVNNNLWVVNFKELCGSKHTPFETLYGEHQFVANTYTDNCVIVLSPEDIKSFRFDLTDLETDSLTIDGIYLINDLPLKENVLNSLLNRIHFTDPQKINDIKLFTLNIPQTVKPIDPNKVELNAFKATLKAFQQKIDPITVAQGIDMSMTKFLTYYLGLSLLVLFLIKELLVT